MSDVQVYADGACKGNPGPGGWGVLIRTPEGEVELFGGDPDTTNNRMELMAAIKGLEALPKDVNLDFEVFTDSQYVKNGISQWIHGWKRNGWRTADKKPVKNAELWRRLDELSNELTTSGSLTWVWVRGHNGHVYNERVDGLANKGVNTVR